VTGSYLGTISHTLTALDSLFHRDMDVLAVIVSETPGSSVPFEETVAVIARFAEPVIALPRRRQKDAANGAGASPFDRLLNPMGKRLR
jgi:dethiobiotin synthetase